MIDVVVGDLDWVGAVEVHGEDLFFAADEDGIDDSFAIGRDGGRSLIDVRNLPGKADWFCLRVAFAMASASRTARKIFISVQRCQFAVGS